jgi:predicted nuclease of restriction endonuclease-like RecB superfamily
MLTKDLLKYRIKAGVVHPAFIADNHADALGVAEQLVTIAQSSLGLSKAEFEERLQGEVDTQVSSFAGLKKILMDRCVFENDSASAEDLRWTRLIGAQAIRNECEFSTVESYEVAVAAHFDVPFQKVAEDLYSDLPDFRRLIDASDVDAVDLVNRYNCGQVQGLLLGADALNIKIKSPTISMQRSLFRSMKFHQLIVADLRTDESSASKDLEIRVDGPMSIFEHSGMYGAKFANFFPRILHFANWEISAELKLKQKNVRLALSHKSKIKSYVSQSGSYVPEELDKFVGNFNRMKNDWSAEVGGTFIDLGKRCYCFSDLTFRQGAEVSVDIELFHKWHAGQLPKRIEALENAGKRSMIIGVCQKIAKNPEFSSVIDNSAWFAKNGFIFKDFPTTRQVLEALARAER